MNELAIQDQITPMQVKICDLVQSAMVITVDSADTLQAATNIRELLKGELKIVEAKEDEFTKPLNETLKKIRAVFKPVKDSINTALLHIQSENSRWHVAQVQLQAELQAKEDKLAAKRKSPLPVPVSRHVELDTAAKKVEGTNWIDHWEARVVDLSSIPLQLNGIQLMTPITSALNKIGNESKGKAEIPGVVFDYKPYQRSGR